MTTPQGPSRVELLPPPSPRAPGHVSAWTDELTIDTYLPEAPSTYPSFFENRVYQGSSGRVYPLPFHERIDATKRAHRWQAVHLENDWLRVVVLPELGGRIYIAYDKTAGYDLFYRNNVIKPALVGLAGPWVSGGVEFNWPQHHRPATFLPTDVEIEHEADGSVIVWCSDHDPFDRMKGMHGVRLRPDSTAIEVDVRLYNRDSRPHTFLWWANVAAAVHDDYQSVFPPDVKWVADHAKRATVSFPAAGSSYYGIDYPGRKRELGGDADRLDWYRNIPVPTSYMAIDSQHEFFGGYDHAQDVGFVHWAPREISPGKKQWTWGNAPFGQAWDRNLTDTDGPYVELMAGVYTDNQPDFAYLAPGETKTFRQLWYPIRGIGPAVAANDVLACNLSERPDRAVEVGLISSRRLTDVELTVLDTDGAVLRSERADLDPSVPYTFAVGSRPSDIIVEARHQGRLLLRAVTAADEVEHEVPPGASEPPMPPDVLTIDELVYIAEYLDQYRHATRSPRPYWEEVLRRDPEESRALLACGWAAYGRADFGQALDLAERSVARRTKWAPTPQSGDAHYLAGLAAERLGDLTHARERLARAAWDGALTTSAGFALARVALRDGERAVAERQLRRIVEDTPNHLQARNLLVALLRAEGNDEAEGILEHTRRLDPLDAWSRHLAGIVVTADATIALDVALEYAAAGLLEPALALLDLADELAPSAPSSQVNVRPLVGYHRAAILTQLGRAEQALAEWRRVEQTAAGTSLASRLDDVLALRSAVHHHPQSALAKLLLGNWECHVGDLDVALRSWREALDAGLSSENAAVAHRNLAVVIYNRRGDAAEALEHYEAALRHRPMDAKLVYERDQLAARAGHSAEDRFSWLRDYRAVIAERDDLVVVWAGVLADLGELDHALETLEKRHFQPWEGGEGKVIAAWDRVCIALAQRALAAGDVDQATRYASRARNLPESLGEQRHPLANSARLELLLGDVADAAGRAAEATDHWERAAASISDFTSMSVTPYSELTVDSVLALRRLGRDDEAQQVIDAMNAWLDWRESTPARIDYFATSLPTMLVFRADPDVERADETRRIRSLLEKVSTLV